MKYKCKCVKVKCKNTTMCVYICAINVRRKCMIVITCKCYINKNGYSGKWSHMIGVTRNRKHVVKTKM